MYERQDAKTAYITKKGSLPVLHGTVYELWPLPAPKNQPNQVEQGLRPGQADEKVDVYGQTAYSTTTGSRPCGPSNPKNRINVSSRRTAPSSIQAQCTDPSFHLVTSLV